MLCFNLWQRNNLPQCVRFCCCCFVSTTKLSFECIMLVISLVFLPLFTRICSPIEGIIKMFFLKWEFSNCKSFLIWGKFPICLWNFSCNYTENVCTNLNKLDMLLFFKTKFLSMNRRKFIRTCNKEYGKIIRNWLWINER